MTNNALERIWQEPSYNAFGDPHWKKGFEGVGVEYIRADHAQAEKEAAVAAEREACAQLCDVVSMDHIGDIVRSKGDEIRARANTDPLAARDARVRAKALKEAAIEAEEVAQARLGDERETARACRDHILDLIPTDQEEKLND